LRPFLSAPNKEKGYLLQQIIGEDVYLKIGETINQKQYEEKKRLEAIQNKINTEDLLSAEQTSKLKEEQTSIKQELDKIDQTLLALKAIAQWYKKNDELLKQENDLNTHSEQLKQALEVNQTSFSALALNEKAEAFKELLNNINRLEKHLVSKNNELENLKKDLELLVPQIEEQEKLTAIANQTLKTKEQELELWSHKLEKVSALDSKIESESENKSKLKLNVRELEKAKTSVEDAKTILQLTRSIKSFEEERQLLKEGEACNLCGSTSHPYVETYKSVDLSAPEKELKHREDYLDNCVNETQKLQIKQAQLKTQHDNLLKLSDENTQEIHKILAQLKSLNLNCDINDEATIANHKNSLETKLKELQFRITTNQELQKEKEFKDKAFNKQKDAFNKLNTSIATQKEKLSNLKTEVSNKDHELKSLEKENLALETQLKLDLAEYQITFPSIEQSEQFIFDLEKAISDYNMKSKSLETLNAKVSEFDIQIKHAKEQNQTKTQEQEQTKITLKQVEEKVENLSKDRNSILPNTITVENQRDNLQKSKEEASKKVDKRHSYLQDLKTQRTSKATLKKTIETDVSVSHKEFYEFKQQFDSQLEPSEFANRQEVNNALLSPEDKNRFSKIKQDLDQKSTELKALKEQNRQEQERLNETKHFSTSKEEASGNEQNLQAQKDDYLKRSGEIKQSFDKDQIIKERNQVVVKEIEAQEKQVKKWKDLIELLGGSKDAFNTYVQRLTLKSLIGLANIHLFKLNNRYSLKMKDKYSPGEELNFYLIDHFQTNEARYVDTSSGGEKFLISLALALGLSDLASSNVKIESLFIDEGFGTLDSNTLETVISTLETLQADGKMIGIISHVENLKERIPTQIQLIKKSNGVSEIEIV
jgi:exonuclease SbcC